MNPNIEKVPPSLIRSINARKRPGDIDLGLGEPTVPPAIEPFEAALEWTRRSASPYSPNAGFTELRERIAQHVDDYARTGAEPERVCVTVGSEEALYLAIKSVIDPARDEVLIVEPCYLAYPKICLLEGIDHGMVAMDPVAGFAPDAGRVLAAVGERTRMIVLNSPSNPTGRVWADTELEHLADGLADMGRSEIVILADEVYRELYYGEGTPSSPARFHERTLIAGSLSKSNSLTGLRLGWLAGPPDLVAAATRVHQFMNTAASTFSQRVAIELFSGSGKLGAYRTHYLESRRVLLGALRQSGVEFIEPEGAFYAFLRIPGDPGGDSLSVARELLDEKRVVTVPGSAFGSSGEGWLRISWVAPPDQLREGVGRIAAFFG